jgi:hypothetical protein
VALARNTDPALELGGEVMGMLKRGRRRERQRVWQRRYRARQRDRRLPLSPFGSLNFRTIQFRTKDVTYTCGHSQCESGGMNEICCIAPWTGDCNVEFRSQPS